MYQDDYDDVTSSTTSLYGDDDFDEEDLEEFSFPDDEESEVDNNNF